MSTLEHFVAFVHSWNSLLVMQQKESDVLHFHPHALFSLKGIITKYMVDRSLIKFLCTRNLNQVHVENLNCMIRGMNGFDDHPTPHSYASALRCLSCKISTTGLIQVCHPESANCEADLWEDSSQTDIQNQAGSSENTDGDDNESDDPIIVSMDPDWENCHQSSCLEPLEADEALPEERLPPDERETAIYIAGATVGKLTTQKEKYTLIQECRVLQYASSTGMMLNVKRSAYTAAKWTSIVALISTIVSGMTIFFWVRSPVVQVPRLAFYKSVTDIAGFSCCLTAVSELATFCLLFMEFDHEEVKYSISMLFTVLSAIAFSVLGIYSFHFGCRREAREPCRLREETDPNAIYAVRIALPSYEEHSKDAMVAPGAGCDAPNEDAPPEYESPPSYEDAGFDVEAASRAISSINL
ncbi:hypothetical protein CAPTEDRAFT_198063 [Capitella teleta]|uniref:Uncharacterized protein n=1 Tax=Capitella teleta TaxID=283909 RepID=X1ZY93_CAPTE|nr:hypothetical protein CAPTEDRAFT_198063 [Capitella teleta]|eukprot:ELU04616.1 hypothetical protein CAPTEDRAFT_198063 [Capitella teleta]